MTNFPDALALARDLLARGFKPVPVPRRKKGKGPVIEGWQDLDITTANVEQYFNGGRLNVGAQMGPKSGGLTDVDLDCPEAVALAPYFLPRTDSIYGRASKRRSHYLYKCSDPEPKGSKKLADENKEVIVELRMGGGGKGSQSVMPGSLHVDSGERYEWDEDGAQAGAAFAVLNGAIIKVAAGTIIARKWPEKNRHDAALRVGGFLARAGWEPDAIGNFMVAVQTVAGVTDPDHVENGRKAAVDAANHHLETGEGYGFPALGELIGEAAAKAIAKNIGYRGKAMEPTSVGGRPVIKVEAGGLSEIADEAEQILIDAGVPFYERSNKLARPIIRIIDAFHGRKTSVAQLARIESVYMRDVLGRVADWYRLDMRSRKWLPTDPPSDVANTILARAGEWHFPTIAGIITTPTMRPDGTIIDQPGYDPATRLLLVNPPTMSPIPESPTREDAIAAIALLAGLLVEFPLVDGVARSVALSIFITPVVRGAFPVAPMHVTDAPDAGAGKSYLLDIASAIANGQPMPVIAAGRTEEETEKRLGSALLAGQPLITIDNVNGELRGDALCQIIERPRPQVRILGKSELIDVETRGTTLFANGNNIVIVGDLCRRVIRAQLDPKMENPELRTFTGDPIATVLANRGAYVAAALTICRAYQAAGRPKPARRLASFEGWSDTVRSALVWLGQSDPVSSMSMSRADDPERSALRELLSTWADVIGTGENHSVTLKEVIALISATKPTSTGALTLAWPELNAAVYAVASGNSRRPPDAQGLGNWMRGHKNRIIGDYRFQHAPDPKHGSSKWWVEKTDGSKNPGKKDVV